MSVKISPPLHFLVEYLDLPEATGMPGVRWETFQLRHLNNASILGITLKSRQVGFSWLAAAESVACGILTPGSTSIFVSINLEEASEKIRYAKTVIDCLDPDVRPTLTTDNRLALEFANGSRIMSHPCRPVRGKARARVYLDEFAHYPNDADIYQSAVPVISKGGVIRIGSSPLGAGGLFWEIYTESTRRYPGYERSVVRWWDTLAMCKDVVTARVEAPLMATEDRVRRFGTERLVQIYENVPLGDFQQEYECNWIDEAIAWIDWTLIKRNQSVAQENKLWCRVVKGFDAAIDVIGEAYDAIRYGHIEDNLVCGADIGRAHDLTEITILGKSQGGNLPYRLGISLEKMEFDQQQAVFERLLTVLPISRCLIDSTGLGMQLGENLKGMYGDKVEPVVFTNGLKEVWAVETKLRFQRSEVPIPLDRDLAYQIHSIKKYTSASKLSVFDCAASEKHHADKFWSLALAIWAARTDWIEAGFGANPLENYRGS